MRFQYALLGAVALLATACGTNPSERTSGGAAAGAATGAGVGALAGPPGMAVGALVGAGAGAAAGATTSPKDVNLGKPPWTNPDTRVPTASKTSSRKARTTHASTSSSEQAAVDQLNERSLQDARSNQ